MSTKTLRKRIALVAVSALGFGLLSVVPTFGATSPVTSLTMSKGTVVAGVEPVTVTIVGTAADVSAAARVTSPSGARSYAYTEATADTGGLVMPALSTVTATLTIPASALLEPGTYTIVGVSNATTAGDLDAASEVDAFALLVGARSTTLTVVSPATSTGMATSMNASGYSGANPAPIIRAWRPTNGTAGDIKFRADVSPDLDVAPGTVVGGADALTTSSYDTHTVTQDDVAGTYTYTAFVDANGNNLVDSTEVSSQISFSIGGAFSAADSTLSISRSLVLRTANTTAGAVLGTTGALNHVAPLTKFTVTLTAVDAAGFPAVPTTPAVYESSDLSNMGDDLANASTLTRVGTSNVYVAEFTSSAAGANTGFTTNTVTLAENSAATTKTATTRAVYLTSETGDGELCVNDVVGVGTIGATGKQALCTPLTVAAATAIVVTVDPTVGSSLTYSYSGPIGAAEDYILVGRTATAGTSTISVPETATLRRLGSDAKATWTETVTATTTEGYTINVYGGNSGTGKVNAAIRVVFATAAPAITVTPSATVLAKDGATTSFAGVLADQYGRVQAAKTVFWSVAGRNPATGTVTTGTDGSIPAVTVVDASKIVTAAATATTAATVNTDTITFTHNYSTATGAAASVTGSRGVTYSLTGPVVASVAISSATTTQQIDQAKVAGIPSAYVTYTATVRNASNVSSGTGVLCTFAGGAGDLFENGVTTSVTNSDGLCSIKAYRDTVGSSAITATAVGITSPVSTPVRYVNVSGDSAAGTAGAAFHDGRYIQVTAGTAVAGTPVTVLAKVTDRFGNPVAGVQVTFGLSGVGRLVAGDSLLKSTNSNGEAQIQVVASESETGTNTVSASFTGSQARDTAGFVSVITGSTAGAVGTGATSTATAAAIAAVRAASATVTFTKNTATSTADALLALATALGTREKASEAVDAAAEATDAANAATDAANAAAEAADAATAAAQDAADAVAALSTQVSEMVAALKKQITSLTNLVIKIQKKVKA